MTKEVYFLLKNRLSEIAEFEEIDWFTGQYDQSGEQPLAVSCACYIEFMPGDWQTLGGKVQCMDLDFDVHVVQDCVLSGEKRISDNALNHLAIVSNVFKKLQHWNALLSYLPGLSALEGTDAEKVIINSIARRSSTPDHSLLNLIVTVQSFYCKIFDFSAVPEYQAVTANLNLDTHV